MARGRGVLGAAALAALLVVAGCASSGAASEPPLDRARIEALLASPDRSAADRSNDVRRKPAEMLAFIGVRPGMVALDVSAGGGYTTELLARAVGPGGRVYGQSAPRNPARTPPAAPEGGGAPAPTAASAGASMPGSAGVPAAAAPRTSPTLLAERAQRSGLANIVPVVRPFEEAAPPEIANAGADLVTLMFNYHDLGHLGVDRARMNAALFAALKPGGVYVIADHAGRSGTGISESGTLHRVEEAFVRREVEAAGFRLVASGDFLRNPNDPRDRNTPEPPQPKDEFVLKFVKP
ncbi:class I SAM-dependent methyltransferase [Piscinibacter koreensis]|uniref:Class I SAM-dependent methyltransferase n=1 Tax=Piscinibacter koreensis TaxID=2742824 RepID=A0A7Y6TUM8_9BURK|nr:class I SAM-dependent methyltransferase [Schlegelella koreensis]NUZ04143.1 class I SAM-dependent methyltransferase [Schlegelella koreensis]